MKKTQLSRLIEYLEEHRTITSLEAVEKLGCTRLAARILELRKKGYIITGRWVEVPNRYGETVRVVEYWYFGKLEDAA